MASLSASLSAELKLGYIEIRKAEKDPLSLEIFLKRVLRGIDQFSLAEKKTDPLSEGRIKVLEDAEKYPRDRKVEFLSSSYRWGKLIESMKNLPQQVYVALSVYLTNYCIGNRSQALHLFDQLQNLGNFMLGFKRLIEEGEIDFRTFASREQRAASISQRMSSSLTYPDPLETIIAAGRFSNRIKSLVEAGNLDELMPLINYSLDAETTSSYSMPASITTDQKVQILINSLIESGSSSIPVLLSIYNKGLDQAAKKFLGQALRLIARDNRDTAIPILLGSLMSKAASIVIPMVAAKKEIEGRTLLELEDSIFHLLDFYSKFSTSKIAKALRSKAKSQQLAVAEELISELLDTPNIFPPLVNFLKSKSKEGLNLSPQITATLFTKFYASMGASAEALGLSPFLSESDKLIAEVKRLVENNLPPSRNRSIPTYQKNILTLASRLLAWEDLVRGEYFEEAGKELRQLLAAATAANLEISHANYLKGYFYAGILLGRKTDQDSEIPADSESSRSASDLGMVSEIHENETYTAFGKDYKELDEAGLAEEVLLYGIIMRNVQARRAKATKIVSILKKYEKVWGNLVAAIQDQRLQEANAFIKALILEAKKEAGIIPDEKRVLWEIKHTYHEDVLEKALKNVLDQGLI
jgi:hypothetical protein